MTNTAPQQGGEGLDTMWSEEKAKEMLRARFPAPTTYTSCLPCIACASLTPPRRTPHATQSFEGRNIQTAVGDPGGDDHGTSRDLGSAAQGACKPVACTA